MQECAKFLKVTTEIYNRFKGFTLCLRNSYDKLRAGEVRLTLKKYSMPHFAADKFMNHLPSKFFIPQLAIINISARQVNGFWIIHKQSNKDFIIVTGNHSQC